MRVRLLAASAAVLVMAAGAASAQVPYGQQPYGQQTPPDPIGAILEALFGDRLGASTTLESEWSRARRPLSVNRARFESQLDADVRSGLISSAAAGGLRAEYGDLVDLEARYTADGRVTARERSDLGERYRTFAARYQAAGRIDDGYEDWRPLAESRAGFDARVDAGVRARRLTRADADRLRRDFEALVRLEAEYGRNGLDQRERRDLQSRWDDLDRRVGDADAYDPYDDYGRDPRAIEIEARIAASERSGRISRAEAARLRDELRDLSRRWADLEARVDARR